MNHLQRIEISNFKSIKHAVIDGCKRVNVFIGYPNVGKTAILEAISLMSYLRLSFTAPLDKVCRFKNASEIFYNYNLFEKSLIESHDASIHLNYVEEDNLDMFIYEKSDQLLTLFKHLNFDRKALFNKEINGQQDLLNLKKYHFQSPFADVILSYKTNGTTLISPDGNNLVDVVQSYTALRKQIVELLATYDLKFTIDPSDNSIKALRELEDQTNILIPFHQLADTLQRLIFHKAAILSNQNCVLLFEEPEAQMFPPYISNLTSDIIFDEQGNQFFISTHSPYVLSNFFNELKGDFSLYLVGMTNGATKVKRLSDEEMQEVYEHGVDLFFNLESYLD